MAIIKNRNLILGGIILMLSGVLYINTLEFSEGARLFPRLIIYIFIANALIMFFQAIKNKQEEHDEPVMTKSLLIMTCFLFAYYFLITKLGFYATSFLSFIFIYMSINKSYHWRTCLKGGVIGVIFMIVVYVIFQMLLNLVTPKGILL